MAMTRDRRRGAGGREVIPFLVGRAAPFTEELYMQKEFVMRMIPTLNQLANRLVRYGRARRKPHPAKTRLAVEVLESRLVLDRTVLDMVHAHLEVNYVNGTWSMAVHDTTNDIVYAPSDVLLYVNANTRQIQPGGWNFIGAGAGNMFWQLPEEEDPALLTIALSTEDTAPATFDTYRPNDPRISRAGEWMKFSLIDLQGPGDISAWQDDQQPPSSWWISSYDGGRTLDPVVYLEPGGHMHLNWGFTAAGLYQATFEVSGFINGHGLPTRSDVTFYFGVEDTGQSPRPPAPLHFGPGMLGGETFSQPVFLDQPLAPSKTSVGPAAEPAPILKGQELDRFFASMTTEHSGSAVHALVQQEAQAHRVDWIGDSIETNDTLLI
jgi:surface-anchored protein